MVNIQQLALQLYTVRDALAADFEGTMRKIAAMGFTAVETAGVYGESVESAARLFQQLGLRVCSAHIGVVFKDQMVDIAGKLGTNTVVCPWLPPQRFQTLDGVKEVCDELNTLHNLAQANGLRFAYHNHDFEFRPLPDGTLPHTYMRANLASSILFELDVYWIQTAGTDPASVVRDLGARAPLLHIKDGPARVGVPMTAAGEGVVNIPAIVEAGRNTAEWFIVEMDQVEGPVFDAVQKSYTYLTRNA